MNNTSPSLASYFLAYPGRPPLLAETMRDSARLAVENGLVASTWQDLKIEGRLLIDPILEAIDECDACIAEVGSGNPNVLFEAGYALSRNKSLYLVIDETDQEAAKQLAGLGFLDTIGRINYAGNPYTLAAKLGELAMSPEPPLMERLLANARPREANAVFAPGSPHKFSSAERLERLLERKTDLKLLASQEEVGLGPLSYYVEEIYRSSAAVLHFMKPQRTRAAIYNGRVAFLAGIVRGLDLPLLMVAEDGYEPPLDYKDLLYVYPTAAKLTEHVSNWLEALPSPAGSNKRLGRLKLDIELPIRTFGWYVAESEESALTNYFVQTNEFEAVVNGRASVFTGRKGTGKTATMLQAVAELRNDRRVLVVPVKPSSYDLSGLVSVLSSLGEHSKREYFLINLWSFLLVSEIALRVLSHAEDLPAGVGGDDVIADLSSMIDALRIDRASDLSTRLDDAIARFDAESARIGEDLAGVTEALRGEWYTRLLPVVRRALHRYDRVAVLVDNLDKTWERGADFEKLSQFLLSLLVTSGTLQREFGKSRCNAPAVNISLTIFLRTDLYDVMASYAREPDKINPQTVQWRDEELLIRILEERYLANRQSKKGDVESLWRQVFDSEVHSLSTRDYLLWRALRRPRDLIFLGNAALTTAINRRHNRVLSQDFIHAEAEYSRFAVEALLVESEAQGFDLEESLFEFAGLDSTIPEDELNKVLSMASSPAGMKNWLVRSSFLGVETRDGRFIYVEGAADARKKIKAAERLAVRLGRQVRYRVHPAFRPYLDIRDDDVHA